MKANILLVGVSYGNCSSFHLAEVLTNQMPRIKMGAAMITENRQWVEFEDIDWNCDDFELIGEAYENSHPVIVGKVGQATCRWFGIKPAVSFAIQWMSENR